MNQLNSNEPMDTSSALFAPPYCTMDETSSGLAAVLMALTITVAPAVPSRFSAVPTRVWSALKLMLATASRQEYTMPTSAETTMTARSITIAGAVFGT